MDEIINSSITTLSQSKIILAKLTDEELTNHNIPPYFSCVGTHIRHILDFYKSIFNGLNDGKIDLTDRKREKEVENNCNVAIVHVEEIIKNLNGLRDHESSQIITVLDDLGHGKIKIEYTIGALLAQANSHTIHHYAIINYLLESLKVRVEELKFGYNPSTPVSKANLN